MNVKRIGTVLMVGLVLLSAMVVVIGTVAATSLWPIQFEGTIEGVAENIPVRIERTVTDGSYTYTQAWNGMTNSAGYFITGKAVFSDEKYTPVDEEPPYPTSAYYQLYINEVPGERKFICVSNGPAAMSGVLPHEEVDPDDGFVYHGPTDCYYIYNWKTWEIPEFSTIAIPVASILGLLFFFNRRKHRKA